MISRRPVPRGALFACLALCALTPRAARAEDADALIKRGVELRRAHQDAEALELFRRAYDLSPTPRCLAQLGLAEQALSRWVDAEAHVARALEAAQDPWIAKYRETLDGSRAEIARHLGWLELAGRPDGADVHVGAQLVGSFPLPRTLRVPAGVLTVVVSARGHAAATRVVSVLPGQVVHEDVVLVPAASSGAPPPVADAPRDGAPRVTLVDSPPAESGPSPRLRKAAWITLASAGGLAVVGGVGLLVAELKARSYAEDKCTAEDLGCQSRKQLGEGVRTAGKVSLLAAGAAGLTSVALFLLSSPPAQAEGRTAFACVPDATRVGATCAWRF